jgi:hypothetical protein
VLVATAPGRPVAGDDGPESVNESLGA